MNWTPLADLPDNFLEVLREKPENLLDAYREAVEWPTDRPFSNDELLRICGAFGYDARMHDIARWVEDGSLERPELIGVTFLWRVHEVAAVVLQLDSRRKWLPNFHDDRKTAKELASDRAKVIRRRERISYYRLMGAAELTQRFAETSDVEAREAIILAMHEQRVAAVEEGAPS